MEEKPEFSHTEDELDFFELYRTVRKRLWLIIALFALSVILAWVVGYTMSPVYRGRIIVRVPVLPIVDISVSKIFAATAEPAPVISTLEVERIINELDILRKERRFDELSQKLLVPSGKLVGLVSLTSKAPKSDKNDYVEVNVDVKNPELIKDLKNGILGYLNSTPYVADKISLKKEEFHDMGKEIGSRLVEIEALKNALSANLRKGGAKIIGFDPIEMEVEFLALKKSERTLRMNDKTFKGFEIVAEPIIPRSPIKPRKAMYVVFAGAASLFAGVVLAFILEMADKRKRK